MDCRGKAPLGSGDMAKYGDIMTETAREHEYMPDAVKTGRFFPQRVKDQAGCVKQTARKKPDEAHRPQMKEKGLQGDDHQPAHHQVNHHRENPGPFSSRQFHDDAQDRQPPYQAEHPPAPRAPEGDQGERRIGAGDEDVNSKVVELAENAFAPASQAVVER